MKIKLLKNFSTALLCLAFGQANAQLIGGNAYMLGDYVEVGISSNGDEGAPCPDPDGHCRGTYANMGFLANPQEDGWVEYNGDFFIAGTPECGFGLSYTLLGEEYHRSNNYDGADILGSITDYTETVDSIIVTWVGSIDNLQLTIVYELKKDEHFYTTSMALDNLGLETFTDVYYYHNFDPDNNQELSGSYTTLNKIESQSEMADDSVIVSAFQSDPWDTEVILHAYGANWKGYTGGFINRNGNTAWNGLGFTETVEGTTVTADQAIGLAYKTAIIPPAKRTETEVFSFATAFKRGVVFAEDEPDTESIDENGNIAYKIYPNPSKDHVIQIQIEGPFNYSITDVKGSLVRNGLGNGNLNLDLTELDKGTYFLKIEQENSSAVEKLVLQ